MWNLYWDDKEYVLATIKLAKDPATTEHMGKAAYANEYWFYEILHQYGILILNIVGV